MNIKKYIAEGLGTLALTLIVALSLSGKFAVPTPILASTCLGLFVYTIGSISGCHINPAVTIGAWSIKKINNKDAAFYILSQMIGALLAIQIVVSTIGFERMSVVNSTATFIAEAVGAFFFCFGIAAVVYEKAASVFSGVVVGGSLFLGVAIASLLGSAGVLNPAVALEIGSFSWVYIVSPIVGAVLGMQAYKYLID